RATILLPVPCREGLARKLRERIACDPVVIPEIAKAAAVQFVAAGLDLNGDFAGDGLADFRVEVLVSNLGFLNGIEVRIHNDNAENRILVVSAVERERRTTEVLAIDHNLLAALR